jgi:hypothetical protein
MCASTIFEVEFPKELEIPIRIPTLERTNVKYTFAHYFDILFQLFNVIWYLHVSPCRYVPNIHNNGYFLFVGYWKYFQHFFHLRLLLEIMSSRLFVTAKKKTNLCDSSSTCPWVWVWKFSPESWHCVFFFINFSFHSIIGWQAFRPWGMKERKRKHQIVLWDAVQIAHNDIIWFVMFNVFFSGAISFDAETIS